MSKLTPHQELALSTSGHMALTANAGSGKTFVLARKYLEALTKDQYEISSVAAITFTEKAASELYLKVSILIDEKINESTSLNEKKQLEKIRRQLVSANISTIHSFCISVLHEYPVEVDLDARFIPIDEKLSEELIELSVEEMIRDSFEDKLVSEELKYLIRIFSSKIKLQNQIVKLIKNRKNIFLVKSRIYKLDEKSISEFFFTEFSNNFIIIWNKLKNDFFLNISLINSTVQELDPKNTNAVEVISKLERLKTETDLTQILKILSEIKSLCFTEKCTIRKRGYLKNEIAESLNHEVVLAEDLMKTLNEFQLPENHSEIELELARFGKTLITFFDFALNIYEEKKKNEGFIDYEDILLYTKKLLENDKVQKSISEKYKFIMVDEFQDTNEIQYQIFLPILDYLKGGKLFIVGDEKQSIYKFRDAEIEIFNLTRSDIKKSVGKKNLLSLPDSFRMTPAICTFCNYVFRNLFSNPDESIGEVPATDLVCARIDDKAGHVEFLVSREADETTTDSEAELVAKKILLLLSNKNYSFKDISILVRKRKYFADLEKVFIKYEIPFAIVGGRGFYQRQSITDVINYLSFLADENNSAALIGLLRSPFFNVSDSKLFEISLNKGRSFWRKINLVKDMGEIVNICKLLNENISMSSSVSLPDLIYKIITDRNFISILSSRNDSDQEIANLNKLISIARNFNAVGFRNLYDFLAFIKDSISNLADEPQAAITSNANAVQMMTIHQSKGLEFPVVFLYKTDEAGISNTIKSGDVKVDKNFGLLTKLPINQNYFEDYLAAPIALMHNYFEEKKNNAELKRLLYVAVTRAKDELYITSAFKKDAGFKKDSFINLLAAGLKNKFENEKINITDQLEMLLLENDKFVNRKEQIKVKIPITTNIEIENIKIEKETKKFDKSELNITSLYSQEKGEIISASKVSIYSQCPLKYLLTYDYGFGKLNSDYMNFKFADKQKNQKYFTNDDTENEFESDDERFESVESEIKDYDTALYGRLFHKAMEKSINPKEITEFIDEEFISNKIIEKLSETLIERLESDLTSFQKSKIFSLITGSNNYKNEFEIYAADQDYFLHGVIDKIIFTDNKVLILDYKTDDIKRNEIKKHSEYYLMQLKFYLYIASKLFTKFDTFEGSLVFIKHPDELVTINYDKQEMQQLENEISNIVKSIRNKNSEKNLKHCKVCSFSGLSNKCIIY
ncbi:MAG: UvrD-helicase domain-containing protein [Ignavibacteriales bacterium]|nr:UvrD-helicase domain-containing protein [Ignavibacteriales bacterium]